MTRRICSRDGLEGKVERQLRTCAIAFLILVIQSSTAVSDELRETAGNSKRDDVIRLLELSNDVFLDQELLDRLFEAYRRTVPGVPESVWEALRAEVDADEVFPLIVGVYDRHFTHQDILGLIEFYESPLGTKLVQSQPLIMRDTSRIAKEWSDEIAERVRMRLQAEGFSL